MRCLVRCESGAGIATEGANQRRVGTGCLLACGSRQAELAGSQCDGAPHPGRVQESPPTDRTLTHAASPYDGFMPKIQGRNTTSYDYLKRIRMVNGRTQ